MSALARLVARATGQAPGGLRPRLPARFETGTGDAAPGIETVTETAAARPAIAPDDPISPMPPQAAAPPQPLDMPPTHRPAKAPPRRARQDVPDFTPARPAEAGHTPTPMQPPPLQPPAPPATGRPPRPSQSAKSAEDGVAPARPAPAASAVQAAPPARVETILGPPPAPLLPPGPPRPDPAPHELHTGPASPPRRALTPPPAPPEITVHIGRLHITTEPRAAQPAPERPRPPRATPSLSNYLRGKEDSA